MLQLLTMQGGFPQAPIGPDRWGTSEGRRAAVRRVAPRLAGRHTHRVPPGGRALGDRRAARDAEPAPLHRRRARAGRRTRPASPAVLGPAGRDAAPVTVRARRRVPHRPVAARRPPTAAPTSCRSPSIGPELLLSLNDPRAQAVGIPGGGGIASAADMAAHLPALPAQLRRRAARTTGWPTRSAPSATAASASPTACPPTAPSPATWRATTATTSIAGCPPRRGRSATPAPAASCAGSTRRRASASRSCTTRCTRTRGSSSTAPPTSTASCSMLHSHGPRPTHPRAARRHHRRRSPPTSCGACSPSTGSSSTASTRSS